MGKPIVTIEEGKIQGTTSHNYLGQPILSFLGIPYAEPPVGDRRFKAPMPKKPWGGVRKTIKSGPPCPSRDTFLNKYVGSETHCLHLNVYTKDLPLGASVALVRPVMVWIHGGAFKMGSNAYNLYGPQYLMTEDIVLVVINYRLGVFGFLSLEDPSLKVPGNAGMKDMVLALQWVQRNIRQFCGNPHNVTIFGGSAGAAAVHHLYLSPMAKGLFHKVIVQSGCALNCWALGRTNGKIIAELLGIQETDERKILHYLRRVAPRDLVEALRKIVVFSADTILPFGPVVEVPTEEPAFLLEQPIVILRNGTFNKVPIIMGYNSNEGILFQLVLTLLPAARKEKDLEKDIPWDLGMEKGSTKSQEVAMKMKKFYFNGEDLRKKNRKKLFPLKSDTQFVYGIHRSINYQKQVGKHPIYLYRMSLQTSLNISKQLYTAKCFLCYFFYWMCSLQCCCNSTQKLFNTLVRLFTPRAKIEGVCHGDDVNYLFKSYVNVKPRRNSIEDISIRRFVKLWTNFARTGNPTPHHTDLVDVIWHPVTPEKNYFLDIGRELTMGSDPDKDRMKFWDEIYEDNAFDILEDIVDHLQLYE